MAIFMSWFHAEFSLSFSWLMMEFYEEVQIAHEKFDLRAWVLVHALRVLSDLTGIDISAKMISRAFRARSLGSDGIN